LGIDERPFLPERYVDTVYLGAFPRYLFDQIGLYDERLAHNQDYELNYRIRAAGGKILCTPAIRSHYYARENLLDLAEQYFRYGFWKWRVIKKHPRSLMARHLVPPFFVFVLLATGLLAPFAHGFGHLFLLILLCYLAASLLASLSLASLKGWQYFLILALGLCNDPPQLGPGFHLEPHHHSLRARPSKGCPTSAREDTAGGGWKDLALTLENGSAISRYSAAWGHL